MSDHRYAFGEDGEQEADRLVALERAADLPSQTVLLELGVETGWRCWEVGAGRGSIARWLSGVVGSEGHVLATDLDDQWFDSAATNISFRCHDVALDRVPEERFDLVHTRFLLEHLADPRGAMARLADALRPGGVLVVEDSAGLELGVTPPTHVLDHFARAWERAGRAVGWNAAYGSELMSDLRMCGLAKLGGHQYRQLAPGGASWAHVASGIKRLQTELIAQGITPEHLAGALRSLSDPANLITGPPTTIAWGQRG
jgi:SAM-dependent methyltransferase